METIRKARKIYTCVYCNGNIQKGEKYIHTQLRFAKTDNDDNQIGIEFQNYRTHNKNCFPRLLHFSDSRNILKNCNKGIHSPTYDADPDSCDMSIWCEWCGIELVSMENPTKKV